MCQNEPCPDCGAVLCDCKGIAKLIPPIGAFVTDWGPCSKCIELVVQKQYNIEKGGG